MSRLGDELHFAPGVPFSNVDLVGGALPKQIYARIDGFYLEPAIMLARMNHVFASGLLAVCAADALGLLMTEGDGSTERMVGLFRKLAGLGKQQDAELFCDHFRNGLVHEARVKHGSEFSLQSDQLAVRYGERFVVNPLLLAEGVRGVLVVYCDRLRADGAELKSLRLRIQRRFKLELNA